MLNAVADVDKTELVHCSPDIHPQSGPRNIYPLHAPDKPAKPQTDATASLDLCVSTTIGHFPLAFLASVFQTQSKDHKTSFYLGDLVL